MTAFPDARPAWQRTFKNRGFAWLCIGAASVSCLALAVLLTALLTQGAKPLFGINDEARVEAMEPKEPIDLRDFDAVDWKTAAAELAQPELAGLGAIDWTTLEDTAPIQFTDEANQLDWASLVAQHDELADADFYANLDWLALSESVQMPGKSWLGATISESHLGQFVTSPPSRHAEKAGIGPALMGTVWICVVCAMVSLPLGVGTAIFLEEYKPKDAISRRIHAFIQLNIANLAGVPSIVYGIIGLTAFVSFFDIAGDPKDPAFAVGTPSDWYYFTFPFGRSVLAGGLTLMLVILPIVIISAQEAIRAVPDSLRQGSLALGATRWQMIRRMTLPSAVPGIMTGSILAMSRAIGEAAPVLIICGIVFIRFNPGHLMEEFTALPLQIYDWAGRPQEEFHVIAASGILILLIALLSFNAAAVFIRQRFQKPLQ